MIYLDFFWGKTVGKIYLDLFWTYLFFSTILFLVLKLEEDERIRFK